MIDIDKRNWKDANDDCQYHYDVTDGRIVGQVNKIAHTKIWLAKIIKNHNDEYYLGQYISCEFAKNAVENYWLIQSRTLIEE